MANGFRIELEKESFIFSSAHFITFNGNVCEPIHGHNYRMKCVIEGELDENHYVIDFIALRDQIVKLISLWDHHVLLATKHPQISVQEISNGEHQEIEVKYADPTSKSKRWIFPKEDCVLLPIENTTAELLAKFAGEQIAGFFKTGR